MPILVIALLMVAQPGRISVFHSNFWINLHHFLYVLGRVEAGMPGITREAVAGAGPRRAEW